MYFLPKRAKPPQTPPIPRKTWKNWFEHTSRRTKKILKILLYPLQIIVFFRIPWRGEMIQIKEKMGGLVWYKMFEIYIILQKINSDNFPLSLFWVMIIEFDMIPSTLTSAFQIKTLFMNSISDYALCFISP